MRVALDVMGGDHGPPVLVSGASKARREVENAPELVLYGDPARIEEELARIGESRDSFEIVECTEQIEMCEPPAAAVRKKRDAPIVKGMLDIKSGNVQGIVSAGSTGAMVAGALLHVGRLPGVMRPAIATWFPGKNGGSVILDVGANAENKPEHLLQFGVMGQFYAAVALGRENPRIGLLNIGEESSKGRELYVRTHELLSDSKLNFVGNIESQDILKGAADVIVCDGFTGNIVLKLAESMVGYSVGAIMNRFRDSVLTNTKGKLAAFFIRNELRAAQRNIRKDFDYAEHGGAPMLGVNGCVIIAHGKSNERAIMNAIRTAVCFDETNANKKMEQVLSSLKGTGCGA
ncbi:MAG: phosphate acyltransferase PlsX [bacterium]|nr:phosphate acyltransferase PlsX [bacterium]